MIKQFKSLYDHNICTIGDHSNLKYIRFAQKADSLISIVKSTLIKRAGFDLRTKKALKYTVGTKDDFDKCRLIVLPVYYLTYNILSYKIGQNIEQYFNLDTTAFVYCVKRDDNVIGIINYRESAGLNLVKVDSINKVEFKLLTHDLIGIKTDLALPKYRKNERVSHFGYFLNNKIFYVETLNWQVRRFTGGGKEQIIPYRNTSVNQLQESLFDKNQWLLQKIKREYKFLVDVEHFPRLKPVK